jgi:hypothetical protein
MIEIFSRIITGLYYYHLITLASYFKLTWLFLKKVHVRVQVVLLNTT